MKSYILAIRDIVANVYTQPITTANKAGSIREFQDRCTSGKTEDLVAKHPEHFELWVIGEYEDEPGSIREYTGEERQQLAAGANFKTIG